MKILSVLRDASKKSPGEVLVRGTFTAGVLLHWVIIWKQNHKHNRERPINTDSPRKKNVAVQWLN